MLPAQEREDRTTQMHVAKAYVVEFNNMHTWQEVTEENRNPEVSVPASGVRHGPLRRKCGIEGQFVNKKLKKGRATVIKLCM